MRPGSYRIRWNNAKLEGCIVLNEHNEHNTVFARIGPPYATGVPWAHPSPKRKRYLDRFRIFWPSIDIHGKFYGEPLRRGGTQEG